MAAEIDKQGSMRSRIEVHVLKAAMLFAVCRKHNQIEPEDLECALALGEYISATADILADLKFGADLKRIEDRMVRILKGVPGKYYSVSELHQKLGGKTNASDLHRLVKSMVSIGLVDVHPESTADRPKAIRWPADRGVDV